MLLVEDGRVAFDLAERGDTFERSGRVYRVEGAGVVTLGGEKVASVVLGFSCAKCNGWTVTPWRVDGEQMHLPKLCMGCVRGSRTGLNLRYALAGHSFVLDGYGYLVRRVTGVDDEKLVLATTCRACDEAHEMVVGRYVRTCRLRRRCDACSKGARRSGMLKARAVRDAKRAARDAMKAESAPSVAKPVTRCVVDAADLDADGYAWSWNDVVDA